MADITIDETIMQFAERVYPIVLKMRYFAIVQQKLYDAFSEYKGDALQEVAKYSQKQMKQINLMCDGYTVLAENLISIVKAFQGEDEAAKKRITDFYVTALSSLDREKLDTIISSMGM